MRTQLFIIDPQRDFCDPSGTLYVPGADKDMDRLAAFIQKEGRNITQIGVTLDSHHQMHIGNPLWWFTKDGKHPSPFTIIRAEDIQTGTWQVTLPQLTDWSLQYLTQLEQKGRVHCVWPFHCLIGTEGHSICHPLQEAIMEWENKTHRIAQCVTKGSNPRVEHFSVFRSEIPDPSDPSCLLNMKLVEQIEKADRILIAGEALSHCVLSSVRDLLESFGSAESVRKTTLLIDGTSSVPDPPGAPGLFSNPTKQFLADMKAKGMKISKFSEI